MRLFYDARDERVSERRGDRRLYWLDDLGAVPLAEARPDDAGFLFAGARPMDDYERLVGRLPWFAIGLPSALLSFDSTPCSKPSNEPERSCGLRAPGH